MNSQAKKYWSAAYLDKSDCLSVLPPKRKDVEEEIEEEQPAKDNYSTLVSRWQRQAQRKVEF